MAFRCLGFLALPCLVLGVACSSDDGAAAPPGGSSGGNGGTASITDGASSDGDATALSYAPCSVEAAVGEFALVFDDDGGYTSLEGKVNDGVDPALVPSELMREGACRLVTPPRLLCDPGCATTTEVCAQGNQCIVKPVGRDVGTVSVSGLVREVMMTPNANTSNYRPSPALPHPGYAPGAGLRLSASGGDYAPFELRGVGVDALEVTSDITVTEGQPVVLAWAPPAHAGSTHLVVRLDVNNHGSTESSIECDFEDSGAAEIPVSLVDALIARGTSGFPSIHLERRSASSTSIEPGCVQFVVSSPLDRDVTITGLVSCTADTQCPEGQTCKAVEQFCE